MKNLLILIAIFILCACDTSKTTDTIPKPVEKNGSLSVKGNRIINKNGEIVSFAGGSLFWSNTGWGGDDFYNTSVVEWLREDWKAGIIRAAMGIGENGGYPADTTNKQKMKTVIDAAIKQGIYVIVDWHSHHAEDYQEEAIDFFQEIATQYSKYDNIIYEIYNEPLNTTSWTNTVKPYSEAVISAIRTIDEDNLIIVGSPTWSQDVDSVALNPIKGYSNIAYTLHFYAGTHRQSLRDKAQVALDSGIALMVTEWGSVKADGDGDVDTASTKEWMDFLCDNNISHCNWAVNDKIEGASALKPNSNPTGSWLTDDLTTSGTLVRNIVKNWELRCKD